MEEIRVLFTACCGWPTCKTIDSLRLKEDPDYKFWVIGVDCSPTPAARNYVDSLHRICKCTDPGYVDELLGICDEENVDIIVPLISDELNILHDRLEEINKRGYVVLMPGKETHMKIVNNKFLCQEYLKGSGIDVMPQTFRMTVANFAAVLNALGYPVKPVCMKKEEGCGSKGFRIIHDQRAMDFIFNPSREARSGVYVSKRQVVDAMYTNDYDIDGYMLQEYMEGEELTTMCLCDHGRTVYSLTSRNICMDMSTAAYCELIKDEKIDEIVRTVNELFKFDGNIGYDFKMNDKGEVRMLEINPRITATVALADKAGVNLVKMGILHALGKKIDETIEPEYGIRLQRHYGTLYEKDGVAYGR